MEKISENINFQDPPVARRIGQRSTLLSDSVVMETLDQYYLFIYNINKPSFDKPNLLQNASMP